MKDKIRTDNQLRFTIAHELGHIFLGHHSSRMLSSFYSSERTRKAHFVEEPGDRPPPENAPTSFAQEYEADTFALNIYNAFTLTEVGFATGERDDESNGMQKARAALIDSMSMREDVEIAFNYWRLVEAVAARARDERGVPSRPDRYYPSAVQRLAHLRHANPGHIVISGEQRAIEKSVDAMIDTLDELSDDAFRSASTRQ